MVKGLVSIITPCYNTAGLVTRLLDSVLEQNYHLLEVIVVDDGSTDDTLAVLNSYRPKFEVHGIPYTVLEQKNGGQSVAINNALKLVKGEFLLWPDSDDFYNRKDAVSLLVQTFNEIPEDYGMIRTLPNYVDEKSLEDVTGEYIIDRSENQFEQALFDRNFIWGFYMIRISAFDSVNPERIIYTEKKAGQNWQMVLPLLYTYKCYFLDENVFSVLVRHNSHSRQSNKNIASRIEFYDVYERTILNTLDRVIEMSAEDRERYKRAIRVKYARQKLYVSSFFADKERARKYRKEIYRNGGHLSLKEFVRDIFLRINLYPFQKSNAKGRR